MKPATTGVVHTFGLGGGGDSVRCLSSHFEESGHQPDSDRSAPKQVASDQAAEWEGLRRSVAMLPPGAWALRREQALSILGSLIKAGRK